MTVPGDDEAYHHHCAIMEPILKLLRFGSRNRTEPRENQDLFVKPRMKDFDT
jgi:hypothetical protein